MALNIFPQYLKQHKGFTLIEMALIIAALGVFISIAAVSIQSLTHSGKITQNRKILSEYDRSVRGFLVSNYRIVCPDTDDDGIEDFVAAESGMTNCADYTGTLPYQTLGLPSGEDAWGNIVRFSMYEPEGTDNASLTTGLVINEIHYDPADYNHEFLELYNNSGSAIDLSGHALTDDITLVFDNGTSIAAGEYIVCVRDASDAVWDGVSYQVFEFSGSFALSGDIINLLDGDSNVVDTVTWADEAPWPAGHDYETYSIELLNPGLENDEGANWDNSTIAGGTPGAENSVYVSDTGTDTGTDTSPIDDTGLCSFLSSQPGGDDFTNRIYVDNATGAFHHQAYILVSGGLKDLDGVGGLFDGYNGKSPDIRFESPDKISDSDYDDFVTAVSFVDLINEIFN